jgi:hypothetical protein
MDAARAHATLERCEALARTLAMHARAGEWTEAATADRSLLAALREVVDYLPIAEAATHAAALSSLAAIQVVYDGLRDEIRAARDRLEAERRDAQLAHRRIGAYLDCAAP